MGLVMEPWKPVIPTSYDSWLGVMPTGELGVGKIDEGRVTLNESRYVVIWPLLESRYQDVANRLHEDWEYLSGRGEASPDALIEHVVSSAWRSGRAYWMRLSAIWVIEMIQCLGHGSEILWGILQEVSGSETVTQETRLEARAILAGREIP